MKNNNNKAMGPLELLGTVFGTLGTVVGAVSSTVTTSSAVINTGLEGVDTAVKGGTKALNLAVDTTVYDLETDSIVSKAHSAVRRKEAETEAARILAKLDAPTTK